MHTFTYTYTCTHTFTHRQNQKFSTDTDTYTQGPNCKFYDRLHLWCTCALLPSSSPPPLLLMLLHTHSIVRSLVQPFSVLLPLQNCFVCFAIPYRLPNDNLTLYVGRMHLLRACIPIRVYVHLCL